LPIVIAAVGLLFGFAFLAVAAFFLLSDSSVASAATPTESGIPTRPVNIVTATFASTDTPRLTPTVSEPTIAATAEEATDEPTATSAPAATDKPASTNPPPPSNPPPTETAAPSSRILNPAFSLEATTVPSNQAIWFNFSVTNANPLEKLPYGALGAAIFNADGVNVHFQGSYTNAALEPGQVLPWRDHTAIGAPGTYTLRLAICYSYPLEACSQPGADWEMLSPPISIVIQ
jgi:hypothetical protein